MIGLESALTRIGSSFFTIHGYFWWFLAVLSGKERTNYTDEQLISVIARTCRTRPETSNGRLGIRIDTNWFKFSSN